MKNSILFRLLALTLVVCAVLTGCQGGLSSTQTQIPTATEEQTDTLGKIPEKAPVYATVPSPLKKEQLDAIPIANASMSSTQLRQICLDYMRLALNFRWVPAKNLRYMITAYSQNVDLKTNQVYAGYPYENIGNANLYGIWDVYDSATGIVTKKDGVTDQNFITTFSTHCMSAAHWGWSRVVNSMHPTVFRSQVAKNGYLPIGEYQYDKNLDLWSAANSTKKVCEDNGLEPMLRSYAKLQPADGVIFNNNDEFGHVQMVVSVHVVTNGDGSINAKESYITILDQGSSFEDVVDPDGTKVKVQGGVDEKETFEFLYNKGYIPFTFGEFIGTDPVEAGEVSLSKADGSRLENGATVSTTELAAATLKGNYNLALMQMTLTDDSGKEIYTNKITSFNFCQRERTLAGFIVPTVLNRHLQNGSLKVKFTCTLGNGETLVAFEGTLTK